MDFNREGYPCHPKKVIFTATQASVSRQETVPESGTIESARPRSNTRTTFEDSLALEEVIEDART